MPTDDVTPRADPSGPAADVSGAPTRTPSERSPVVRVLRWLDPRRRSEPVWLYVADDPRQVEERMREAVFGWLSMRVPDPAIGGRAPYPKGHVTDGRFAFHKKRWATTHPFFKVLSGTLQPATDAPGTWVYARVHRSPVVIALIWIWRASLVAALWQVTSPYLFDSRDVTHSWVVAGFFLLQAGFVRIVAGVGEAISRGHTRWLLDTLHILVGLDPPESGSKPARQ